MSAGHLILHFSRLFQLVRYTNTTKSEEEQERWLEISLMVALFIVADDRFFARMVGVMPVVLFVVGLGLRPFMPG